MTGLGHCYSTLPPNSLKYLYGSLSFFHSPTSNNLQHCLWTTCSHEIQIYKRRSSRKHIAIVCLDIPRKAALFANFVEWVRLCHYTSGRIFQDASTSLGQSSMLFYYLLAGNSSLLSVEWVILVILRN